MKNEVPRIFPETIASNAVFHADSQSELSLVRISFQTWDIQHRTCKNDRFRHPTRLDKESKVVEIYCEKNEIHLNERMKQSKLHCALFEVHITLGSRSEVSAFIYWLKSKIEPAGPIRSGEGKFNRFLFSFQANAVWVLKMSSASVYSIFF